MMKKPFLVVVLIVILAGVAVFKSNTSPRVLLAQIGAQPGLLSQETQKYRIHLFGLLPVGQAEFFPPVAKPYNGQDMYYLRAIAQNLGYLSGMFSASALLESYVDTRDLLPVMFSQKIKIKGKPDLDRQVLYDQKNGVISTFKGERAILPETYEPLSVMQHLRRIDFDTVRDFEMNINTNQKNYTLSARSVIEEVMVSGKIYPVVRVRAAIFRKDKNNPYHRTKVEMFLLKGKENIPFLINVVASGVFINVRLSQ